MAFIGRVARYNNTTAYGTYDGRYNHENMFTWDNNTVARLDGSSSAGYGQRMRAMGKNGSVNCRYIWPMVAHADPATQGSNGMPKQSEIEAHWTGLGRDVDAADGTGLYIHTAEPFAIGDRAVWAAGYPWLKFADPAVLNYLFGPAGAEGAGSWVESNYFQSYDSVDYFGHDVFSPYTQFSVYSGAYTPEADYGGNLSTWPIQAGERWYEYLTAFRARILDPLGKKIICNRGSCRENYIVAGHFTVTKVFDDFYDLIDGYFFEDWVRLAITGGDSANPMTPWDYDPSAGVEGYDYHFPLKRNLELITKFNNDGKIIACGGGANQRYGFRLRKNNSIAGAYVVQNGILTLGGSYNYTLSGKTLYELVEEINAASGTTHFEAQAFAASQAAFKSNNGPTTYDTTPALQLYRMLSSGTALADNSWTNYSTTAPVSPILIAAPRAYLVTVFAFFLLAGLNRNSKIYIGLAQEGMSSSVPCDSDLHEIVPLLGSPSSTQTIWEKPVGGSGWGDVYCRRYENGVVFFNWEAYGTGSRIINSSDYGVSAWYPLWNDGASAGNVYTPGESWASTTSITLPPRHGEICLYSVS